MDIAPELLKIIEIDFNANLNNNKTIMRIDELMKAGKATYVDANEYSAEVGKILAEVFGRNISAATLPDGRMYYNIAERILEPTLGKNHELISKVAEEIQTNLNKASGLGIKAVKVPVNKDRIRGIIERVSSETDYNKVSWILDQPIVNYSQSIVDESIKANAEFHFRVGLAPKIVRTSSGGACSWCREVSGTYAYPDVPEDVYRRHDNCYCSVDYNPGDGKKQNVHSKRWL